MTTFGSELKLAPLSLTTERLQTSDSPQSLFVKVQEEFENAFLLESAIGAKRLAEYSFIGFEPETILKAKDGRLESRSVNGAKESAKTEDPLFDLRKILAAPSSSDR